MSDEEGHGDLQVLLDHPYQKNLDLRSQFSHKIVTQIDLDSPEIQI
jgi:hypothetical protein